MKAVSSSLAALLSLTSVVALADDPIVVPPIRIVTRDLTPVSLKITSLGHGEFPQLFGSVVVKNVGTSPVKYVGPQTCQENPFGGAPTCYDVTTLKINDLYAWVYDTVVTIQPGETKELSFSAVSTDHSLTHCGIATVSFDVDHKFNQFSVLGNVYSNDTAKVRTFFSWEKPLCRIPLPFPLPAPLG